MAVAIFLLLRYTDCGETMEAAMADAAKNSVRSPSYPNMSLRDATVAVGKIEAPYRSAPVDRESAVKLLGYNSLSGPANKALAALASYGLVERAGKGLLRVTTRAKMILHPRDDEERYEGLKAAALEPRLFQEIRDHFEGIVLPEQGVETYLNRQGFNQSAIKSAAKAFLQTMAFLEEEAPPESHRPKSGYEEETSASNGDTATVYRRAKVGDLVQWEPEGVPKFRQPLRVRLVSEDGEWVAVEGIEKGIPMREVNVQPNSIGSISSPIFPLSNSDAELEPAVGEEEWMRNKVGHETYVRLLVKGNMGAKEIGKLIKILEAQKAVLEDE